MKEFDEYTFPWLVFKLNNCSFAVNCETITSITILPEQTTSMPHMPDYMRGLLNLRGTIIPLLDMRCLFGMPSMKQECSDFSDMMNLRIQDHLNWVDELMDCVKTKREFTLATDPHKCAFGLWYDNYKSENNLLNFHLKKIDEPHKKLHGVGLTIKELMREVETPKNQKEIENQLITLNKQLVPQLVGLLKETAFVLKESYREMVVVLEHGKHKIGLIVDEVHSVEPLDYLCDSSDMQSVCDAKYVKGVGKSSKTSNMILLVNENEIRSAFKPSEIEDFQKCAEPSVI